LLEMQPGKETMQCMVAGIRKDTASEGE
jgi:hypothetical protein